MRPNGFNAKHIKTYFTYIALRRNIKNNVEAMKKHRLNNAINLNEKFGTGGKTMQMKFDKYEVVDQPGKNGKTWKMCAVTGEQIGGKGDGDDRTLKFFCSAKDMYSAVKTFVKGDIILVGMKQNGNYWNPTSFARVDADVASVDAKVSADVEKAVPNVSSDESLRLAALKIAVKVDESPTLDDLFRSSEDIVSYIKNGYDTEDTAMPEDTGIEGLDDEPVA